MRKRRRSPAASGEVGGNSSEGCRRRRVLRTRHNARYRALAFGGARMIVDVERLLESEDLARLVEVAEGRGRVRASQLNEVLETLQLDGLESESIYRELEKRAIEVVEDRRSGDYEDRRPLFGPGPV